jgi:hypothetical protein
MHFLFKSLYERWKDDESKMDKEEKIKVDSSSTKSTKMREDTRDLSGDPP